MALSSSSTLAEVKAEYFDNAGWETSGSVEKAAAFMNACNYLVVMLPAEIQKDGESITLDVTQIEKQLAYARRWYRGQQTVSSGGPGVKHVDFRDFRN